MSNITIKTAIKIRDLPKRIREDGSHFLLLKQHLLWYGS